LTELPSKQSLTSLSPKYILN